MVSSRGEGGVRWVMARVYVSSTIADLRRERRAVMDWLVAAQHQVVHSYRPDGETVRDSCLEDVDLIPAELQVPRSPRTLSAHRAGSGRFPSGVA